MYPRNCLEIRSREKGRYVLPTHFSILPQLLQLSLDIDDREFRRSIQGSPNHRFVLFLSSEQVEYTRRPPTASWRNADFKMATWRD